MDTLIVAFEDTRDLQLRPWVSALASPKTYRRGACAVLAVGSLACFAHPSLAANNDWDYWNSDTREEQSEAAPRNAQLVSENELPPSGDPGIDYQTGRRTNQNRNRVQRTDRPMRDTQPEEQMRTDRPMRDTPGDAVVETPGTSNENPPRGQVLGDNWRVGGRQTREQAALEANPSTDEKDCDGRPYTESDIKQAEVDSEGNLTPAGLETIKKDGRAYCSANPNASQCKQGPDGDVG